MSRDCRPAYASSSQRAARSREGGADAPPRTKTSCGRTRRSLTSTSASATSKLCRAVHDRPPCDMSSGGSEDREAGRDGGASLGSASARRARAEGGQETPRAEVRGRSDRVRARLTRHSGGASRGGPSEPRPSGGTRLAREGPLSPFHRPAYSSISLPHLVSTLSTPSRPHPTQAPSPTSPSASRGPSSRARPPRPRRARRPSRRRGTRRGAASRAGGRAGRARKCGGLRATGRGCLA